MKISQLFPVLAGFIFWLLFNANSQYLSMQTELGLKLEISAKIVWLVPPIKYCEKLKFCFYVSLFRWLNIFYDR